MKQDRTLFPMGYFLTFNTFGTWLPGDDRGWCRRHGAEPVLPPSRTMKIRCGASLRHSPVRLGGSQVVAVHASIVETCALASWPLHALVVEGTHAHAVVSAALSPEEVVRRLKAWATRALRTRGEYLARPVWSAHASTRYLHTRAEVEGAIEYVLDPHHRPSGAIEASDR